MYSVVLMMALSGGSEAVDFGHRCSGGHGGHGCTGYVACSGSYGCTGYTSSYGCTGSYVCSGCTGGHGHGHKACSGGGHRLFGGHGCTGGHGHHGHKTCCGTTSYVGCYGGTGYVGGAGGAVVTPVVPSTPLMGTPPAHGITTPETIKPLPKPDLPESVSVPAPATIVVTLPANATLSIDGNPTTSTSSVRTLVSPALEPGSTYVYTLRAEVNGQIQTQQVQVRGGETSQAQFSFTQGVASR
jgi:uncharacterized protein (TIGR03000 family)